MTELEALQNLCNSLKITHGRAQDMSASIPYTSCPCCGSMNLYEHVPDLPRHHKPDCALVQARRVAFG